MQRALLIAMLTNNYNKFVAGDHDICIDVKFVKQLFCCPDYVVITRSATINLIVIAITDDIFKPR